MATTVNQIRKKNVIRYEGRPCLVLENTIKTPPNLRPHCQMQIRDIVSGKVSHLRLPVSESFEVLPTDARKLEYLYENQGVYTFMDPESFENYDMSKDTIEDALKFMAPNQQYEFLFVDDKPLVINLPPSVVMQVAESPEGIRGDTASNVQKPAIMETGMTVMVPLFIKTGEMIKVSTENGSYLGRA
jgi:elongation factor P